MSLNQLVVILLIISISIGMCLVFFRKNKRLNHVNEERLLSMDEEIAINRFQIQARKKGLDHYDFLKYNLSEALIIQLEINI